MKRRILALVLLSATVAAPASAGDVYQISTISSLVAGGYDGTTTVGAMLRHGNFGLGTFNGVNGEMVVLDNRVYRCTTDGRAHSVPKTDLTPFAVVTEFHPQGSAEVAAGQSLDQLQARLDALPYSSSRILVVRINGRFQTIEVRSEPEQKPPYRPLADVIKAEQVVHILTNVEGTLVGFRFPATAGSVNVAGWHFHFITTDRGKCGHVLGLTTGPGRALLEDASDLHIRFPATAPSVAASTESVKAVEHPQ